MVLCKFYQQGNCRFGENCKNEHQLGGSQSTSLLRQQSFNPGGPQQQPGAPVDNNTLIKSVQTDTTSAEKGGQWLFSTYAPFKDKPMFPGLEDQSFEEIRWGFYDAKKNGMEEKYKQDVQRALQDVSMKVKSLQNPNPEAQKLLIEIYHSPPGSGTVYSATPALFTQTGMTNVFARTGGNGFNQPPTPIFANSAANTHNIFGSNQSSIFGAPVASTGGFGSSAPLGANQNQNVFGKSASIFGGQSSAFGTPSAFGAQPTSVNSVFGNQQNSSPFQSQASVFANSNQNTSVFGQNSAVFSNQAVQNSSLFGQQGATPSFGGGTTSQSTSGSIFGSQPQGSLFAQAPTSMSAFSGSSFNTFRNPTDGGTTGSIFGGQPATSAGGTSIFANAVASFNLSQNSNAPFGAPQNVSPFSSTPSSTSSLFGAPPNSTAPFGGVISSSSPFSATTNSAPGFGATPGFGVVPAPNSLYGTTHAASVSPFGMAHSAPGMVQSIPGMEQSTPGMVQSIPGMVQSIPGMEQSAPGMVQSIPGMVQSIPGMEQSVFDPSVQISRSIYANVQEPNLSLFPTTATSVFSSQPQTTTASLFGVQSTTSIFGSQPISSTSSVFASPPPQNLSGGFGSQTSGTQSIFGTSQAAPAQSQGGSLFGAHPSQTGFAPPSSSHSASIFGGNAGGGPGVGSGSIFGGVAALTDAFSKAFYSKLEDLTDEELNSFKADTFEFGKIPDKPPPIELCK